MGSGFNHIFPDKKIFEEILANEGTIITEYSPEVGVFPQGFRDRNRIVAGLSMGVLIIEAKQHSGTGITANYAKQFERKIFCIPHSIEDKSGVGTNRLIKKGALLVTEIKDILQYFESIEEVDKIENVLKIEIPEEYKKVYEQIQEKALNRDEIAKRIKMNISKVNTILTMLELEGYIESLPGNCFKKKE